MAGWVIKRARSLAWQASDQFAGLIVSGNQPLMSEKITNMIARTPLPRGITCQMLKGLLGGGTPLRDPALITLRLAGGGPGGALSLMAFALRETDRLCQAQLAGYNAVSNGADRGPSCQLVNAKVGPKPFPVYGAQGSCTRQTCASKRCRGQLFCVACTIDSPPHFREIWSACTFPANFALLKVSLRVGELR